MLQKIRFFDKKNPKTIVIRIIVLDDNIQIYSYGLLCEHVLSMRTVVTSLSSFQRSNWSPTYILHLFHLEDTSLLFIFLSESVKVRFIPRVDEVSSKWNKCRIYVGDQLDRWNELRTSQCFASKLARWICKYFVW
jgi:hypothetical protein